eukprot:CAMPEP_0197828802 /NCGR_PEP_ID=MMETSP1437-20131217/5325_1 /TAXON_ID=49252 ORGANISM="Eucampia antarctica, Strain CCMP1452" /NCGR_SAMPLE_ID=MMETSP1437 /ASSEMBLY_ACC=CAM_ASM_001096 /LENGTH=602 /DNA_ID=CAMNT_0043430189 /DNA_START=118 /DNA_END=1924 /DNA_ORIENTATION=-
MTSPSPSRQLVVIFVALLIVTTVGHRSLPSGITCGSQFSSPNTPLTIPNSGISWANYGIYTCEDPINWLEAEAVAGQDLKFTITVPVIDRFASVRMSAVFIGPGLPALLPEENTGVSNDILQYAADNVMGGVVFKSPQVQTNCDHLHSQEMIDATTVKDGRCDFYEPFGGSNMWVVMDDVITVSESGTYKVAVYEEHGFTAKASFACCDWPEDFLTPYSVPESTCPACGTNSSNPVWSSLYFEHKSMAQFSGFPPIQNCSMSTDIIKYPSKDMCPLLDGNDNNNVQLEKCKLGCNSLGECHSHNVFGGCTHFLDWNVAPKFGDAPVNHVIIFKGDKIKFTAPTGMPHNLFQLPNEISLDQCDFSESSSVAQVGEIFAGYEIAFDVAGIFYFSCTITGHCNAGQRLTVEVKDALDGLKCHRHEEQEKNSDKSVLCQNGQVNARAIDSMAYGSSNANECAEFCTSPTALSFMSGVEAGSCSDIFFKYNPLTYTLKPPNSPADVEVVVFSIKDEFTFCHCHSYEEIACPEEENMNDALYDEHIQEITKFCTGIMMAAKEIAHTIVSNQWKFCTCIILSALIARWTQCIKKLRTQTNAMLELLPHW